MPEPDRSSREAPPAPDDDAPVVVSACLLGRRCRYDARTFASRDLRRLADEGRVVSVCPEEAGGLPTPRPPAEIEGEMEGDDVLGGRARVLTEDGDDVTAAYLEGAARCAVEALRAGATRAYLKARSPSCGVGRLAADTATGTRPGHGVFAALLRRLGIEVVETEPDER